MYQNMTREEMIQRLYEGNFTTGELERQLIAKLFEQCCGGRESSGGEALIVHVNAEDGGSYILDKTAAEIYEAFQSFGVMFDQEYGGDHTYIMLSKVDLLASGAYNFYINNDDDPYTANTGNDYPRYEPK